MKREDAPTSRKAGRPHVIFRVAHRAETRLDGVRRKVRRRLGIDRPLRVLPYRGFGTTERALIKARTLEDRHIRPPPERRTIVGRAIASYKRYATHETANVTVRVHWGGKHWESSTDPEGFLELWVKPPDGVKPGWNQVELELLGVKTEHPRVRAPVLIVGNNAEFGIISDIDDTVIETGVTNLFKRAYALFLAEARTRPPFEGVAGFYAALRDGRSGRANNPLFYVSSSPWNLFEHLEEFLEHNNVPFGPLLLRDWGLSEKGFAPLGGHRHKLEKIEEVLSTLPNLPFILIGDSGQEDAEHYRTVVKDFPGRILCVYIRNVTSGGRRDRELDQIGEEIRQAGSEMVVIHDTLSAAEHAVSRGLLLPEELRVVEQQVHEDEEAGIFLDRFHRR